MHRIDAPGNDGGFFTEGNPALSIPATQVSDDWLNDVQEELNTVIEGQGITLVKGQQDQLNTAILNMIGVGGSSIKIDPLVNNTADQVITGLIFNKVNIKGALFFFDVHRETDSSNVQETGIGVCTYDIKDDLWRVSKLVSSFDSSGAVFNITSTGQVRVTTDDLTGANYDGQIRITSVTKFSI